jgi:hypothetical protein
LKKLKFLLVITALLSVSGCAPEPVLPVDKSKLTYEQLSELDDYQSVLKENCDPTLGSEIGQLNFLPDVPGVASLVDLMKLRTERILEATGTKGKESDILIEAMSWNTVFNEKDGYVDITDWSTPETNANKLLFDSFTSKLFPFLFEGGRPLNSDVRDRVVKDWLETCGQTSKVSQGLQVAGEFEKAFKALRLTFTERYISKGYTSHTDALLKADIDGKVWKFDFVKLETCEAGRSLYVNVSFNTKPDLDGLTKVVVSSITLESSNLADPEKFNTTLETRFIDQRDTHYSEVNNVDFSTGKVASASCGS